MTTLEDVKKHPQILEYINQTEIAMDAIKYTNHGLRHSEIVSTRCMELAKKIGLSEREAELAAIAGFCHDMGNFMTRAFHHFFGGLLFSQVFTGQFEPRELAQIIQAISNHDKEEMNFTQKISAILVLADKSDVDRTQVTDTAPEHFKNDIHDRVNYAAQESMLTVEKPLIGGKKRITLTLKIDTTVCPVMEYFEIFTERMVFCRKAAQFLGYEFGLEINKFKLL